MLLRIIERFVPAAARGRDESKINAWPKLERRRKHRNFFIIIAVAIGGTAMIAQST